MVVLDRFIYDRRLKQNAQRNEAGSNELSKLDTK